MNISEINTIEWSTINGFCTNKDEFFNIVKKFGAGNLKFSKKFSNSMGEVYITDNNGLIVVNESVGIYYFYKEKIYYKYVYEW